MSNLFSWNNLSVKYKLFSLVICPIILLLVLEGEQLYRLSMQAKDLERAQRFSHYVNQISYLYTLPERANETDKIKSIEALTQELVNETPEIFKSNSVTITDLLISFEEANVSLVTNTDLYERIDILEWRADTYKQLLLAIENESFERAPADIQNHMSALTQIEWLMFWSREENKLSQYLVFLTEDNQEYDSEISEQIETLVQNQQLFMERFVNLNANQDQVSFLINTFTNDIFINSQMFRAILLDQAEFNALPPEAIAAGISALVGRLSLLQQVSDKVTEQLRADLERESAAASQKQLVFITVMLLMTILVVTLAVRLSRKVTGDLNLVLAYLGRESYSEDSPLTEQIQSKDELGQFAHKVEELTCEREEARQKLTRAKEDAEQAKDDAIRASKAKSSFLANMSHEIRTPLNGVIGISEILSGTSLDATQRDYVDTIETSSQLLLSLINDVLDFSKIESGMLLISPHSTCVRESIYDIASVVSPKAKEKGIDLEVSISPNTPHQLMVDDHRLRQVIMNFASNAVKFTERGRVGLTIDTKEISEKNVVVEFGVEDSGIGIDEQQQKNIFEPFTQEDDSTTRQFGGTGLGLAISTQLVELMGGTIGLNSEKGKGSRFYFSLELPLMEQEYQSINQLHHSDVWLLCEDQAKQDSMLAELSFYKVPVAKTLSKIDEMPASIDKPVTLVFVETTPNLGIELEQHTKVIGNDKLHLCLVKHLQSERFDFSDKVKAILTQPLLGKRLVRGLESCDSTFLAQGNGLHPGQEEESEHRILIVDDNKVNQKIASLHAKKLGFPSDTASSGSEAIELFKKRNYSLILMDCMMPEMDGFRATGTIRQLEKERGQGTHTPIIALTASVVDDDIQTCFDVGMDDYMAKPFKIEQLKTKIEKAINLPVKVATSQPKAKASKPATQSKPTPSRSEKVLLVEDNKVNQKVASVLLQKAGFEYEIAENGQIAVEMFQKDNSFDIILMDCMMPVMDGFQATKEIRAYEQDEGLTKTPIIALTASVIDDDIQHCYDSGMDAYVPKPVRKEKLLDQIDSVM